MLNTKHCPRVAALRTQKTPKKLVTMTYDLEIQ